MKVDLRIVVFLLCLVGAMSWHFIEQPALASAAPISEYNPGPTGTITCKGQCEADYNDKRTFIDLVYTDADGKTKDGWHSAVARVWVKLQVCLWKC